MAILTVSDISLAFGEETIIENVSFELQKGEHVGLVGVNGSGKTVQDPDRRVFPGYRLGHILKRDRARVYGAACLPGPP